MSNVARIYRLCHTPPFEYYLYVELGLLVEDLAVVALAAEVIDAVVDVVVVFVVVLRGLAVAAERRIVGAAVVLVLGQVGVRQQGRRQMLEAGIVGVDDAAAARRQIPFLGPVGPLGRRQLARRVLVRGVTPCNISRLHSSRPRPNN